MATLPAFDHARACPGDGDSNTDTTDFVFCAGGEGSGSWDLAHCRVEAGAASVK